MANGTVVRWFIQASLTTSDLEETEARSDEELNYGDIHAIPSI